VSIVLEVLEVLVSAFLAGLLHALEALFMVVLIVAVVVSAILERDRSFDSAKWRAVHAAWIAGDQECRHAELRLRMIHDIERHHVRPGMTAARVTAILGHPEAKYSSRWEYFVGDDGLDCITFDLTFDRNERLARSDTVHH
jgi:hypothetical protein